MARTKEQVLAVKGLTEAQKERVNAFFLAQVRFKKEQVMPVETDEETIAYINKLQKAYDKRTNKKKEIDALKALVDDAKKYGFTLNDVTDVVNGIIKDKKNAEIRAKMAELEKQLIP